MKEKIPFYIGAWLMVSVVSLPLALTTYVAVQHSLRSTADQAPVQATQQIVDALKQGATPDQIVRSSETELADLPIVFAAIFDDKRKAVVSSFKVAGGDPILPSGVFDTAHQRGEDRFTWQPQMGVREAAVLVPYSQMVSISPTSSPQTVTGFVLAGQSLTETERAERATAILCLIGWGVVVVLSFLLSWLLFRGHEHHHHHHAEGSAAE